MPLLLCAYHNFLPFSIFIHYEQRTMNYSLRTNTFYERPSKKAGKFQKNLRETAFSTAESVEQAEKESLIFKPLIYFEKWDF